jgi:hypothetical protein
MLQDSRAATVLESPPSLGPVSAVALRDRPQFTRPRADVRGPSERPPAFSPPSSRPPRAEGRGRSVAIAAVIVLGLASVAGGLFALRRALRPTAQASLSRASGDPVVELAFTGVNDGEHVSCLGHELVVAHGRVTVPVRSDTFVLGANEFVVHVGRDALSVQLPIDRWASRDEAISSDDPPRLGVIVRAPAGTSVSIDATEIALDASGVGRWSVPIEPGPLPVERVVAVRWARGTRITVDRVRLTSLPATLEVHQPPVEFTTDRTSLALDAAVGATATVLLDGTPLAASGGHVHTTLALPTDGEHRFRLDVNEPGRHRRVVRFVLKRVDDLSRAAGSFTGDPSLTYAIMAANPERAGSLVDVVGRVFHIRVENGRSMLQLLVTSCTVPAGCPLWVEYPAVTAARIGEVVRVRGRFAGMQSYRDDAAGAELRAPRIDAEFVTVGAR